MSPFPVLQDLFILDHHQSVCLKFLTFWFLSSRANYLNQQFFANELKGNLQSALKLISFCLQDLLKDLKYELGGNFETIVIALMMPSADYDATSLRKAIKVCFVSLLIRR